MVNSLSVSAVFVLLAALCAAPARADFIFTQTFTVNTAIPDSGELADVQTLAVGGGTISDISIGLTITSVSASSPAFIGDYYAAVGHDDSYAVLLNRIGKASNDLSNPAAYGSPYEGVNVTFADSAANGDIHAATPADVNNPATLTGTWAPDARETDPAAVLDTDSRTAPLSSFNGVAADGQWRLFIADDSAGGTGVLTSWTVSLKVTPTGAAPLTVASGGTLTTNTPTTLANNLVNQGHVVGPTGSGQALTFTGTVSGAGDYTGNFVFNGNFSPGNSPAAVSFTGDLTLASGNVLTMEIGGATPGTGYDTLTVSGQLTLGGTLDVVFLNGFIPSSTDTFQFFNATSIGGTFAQINLPPGFAAIGDLLNGGAFSLSAIPEPTTTTAILALVAFGFVIHRHRRRVKQTHPARRRTRFTPRPRRRTPSCPKTTAARW